MDLNKPLIPQLWGQADTVVYCTPDTVPYKNMLRAICSSMLKTRGFYTFTQDNKKVLVINTDQVQDSTR